MLFLKVYDRTHRVFKPEAVAKESGLRGMFAQKMLAGLAGENGKRYRKAMEYGLLAIEGEKVKPL